MNFTAETPKILLIYNLAKMGLIPGNRNCPFCNNRMLLTHSIYDYKQFWKEYVWKCSLCLWESEMHHATMFRGMDGNTLEMVLTLLDKGIDRSGFFKLFGSKQEHYSEER